jgi:hypothetical protein
MRFPIQIVLLARFEPECPGKAAETQCGTDVKNRAPVAELALDASAAV